MNYRGRPQTIVLFHFFLPSPSLISQLLGPSFSFVCLFFGPVSSKKKKDQEVFPSMEWLVLEQLELWRGWLHVPWSWGWIERERPSRGVGASWTGNIFHLRGFRPDLLRPHTEHLFISEHRASRTVYFLLNTMSVPFWAQCHEDHLWSVDLVWFCFDAMFLTRPDKNDGWAFLLLVFFVRFLQCHSPAVWI